MLIDKIIRAWQDPEYRKSLSDEERALLLEDPVGQMELTEDELTQIKGAANVIVLDQSGNAGPGPHCPNTKSPNAQGCAPGPQ